LKTADPEDYSSIWYAQKSIPVAVSIPKAVKFENMPVGEVNMTGTNAISYDIIVT
jgi:hypothetical protein